MSCVLNPIYTSIYQKGNTGFHVDGFIINEKKIQPTNNVKSV